MQTRRLGHSDVAVSRMGYGAMVLEGYYGGADEEAAVATLVHAIEKGMMIDTADAYGNGHNEALVARAAKEAGRKATVATKFGIVFKDGERSSELPTGWGYSLNISGRPDYVARAMDASLRRLGSDSVDLWYAHYLDPAVPVEETVGAMAEQVTAGKARALGLSNVTADEVRRAHAVHPIAAVQYEYSLWRREVERDLLPVLRELGIALVPWSPLGSGFLTGTVKSLDKDDFRNNNPRYSDKNLSVNRDRFAPLSRIAESKGITSAQLALAWLLHQGDDIFPIPGTRKASRIDENAGALDVALSREELDAIEEFAAPGTAVGGTLV